MRVVLASCADLPDWEVDDRPLVAAFERLGVDVQTVAWDAEGVAWGSFDACLIRTTWDYMERRETFVAWAEAVERETRLFNGADVVRWNTHKSYLRDLEERGVPVIPTVWLERGTDADVEDLVRARGWGRGFLKPAVGATARETLRFAADEAGLATARRHATRLLAEEDLMLQPYLSRVESEGELSALYVEGELTHAVRKVPVPGDYRVQNDFGAHDEPSELSRDERAQCERILAAIELPWLYARIDFLRGEGGELLLGELELVEPSFFFRHGPRAADRLAEAVRGRVLGS